MVIARRVKRSVAMFGVAMLALVTNLSALDAAQSARIELRKIADNIHVMQNYRDLKAEGIRP